MTKIRIQRSDDIDHVPVAELNLDAADAIPRVGDSISFPGDSGDFALPWRVLFVTHEFKDIHQHTVDHTVVITIQPLGESQQEVYVEWQNETERPGWVAEDMRMACDSVPCRGDIIQIGVNDEKYATKESPIVVVEVMQVVHTTLLVPDDDLMNEADQTTIAAIVRTVDLTPIGDMQRVIASRRN